MAENPFHLPEKKPERPLECAECKKPIKVVYTEIVGNVITHTSMCASCPVLERRLHGIRPAEQADTKIEKETGIACGDCGTTLAAVHRGADLGCSTCYEVFTDAIISEIDAAHKIPPQFIPHKKGKPLHFGRAPGEAPEINPALHLLALNEALQDTLQREDYEQAALLRDEIKALTEEENSSEE